MTQSLIQKARQRRMTAVELTADMRAARETRPAIRRFGLRRPHLVARLAERSSGPDYTPDPSPAAPALPVPMVA